MMPGVSGPEFCRTLKADRKTQLIPILMLTSVQGVENELAGIASGADEFLIRPQHLTVVRARVRAMLRNKATIDSLEEAESILFALAQAVEHRDKYTAGHCQRLAWYSVALGMTLGLSRPQLLALHRGGFLHDIGKIVIPDAILHKNGRLTEDEWVVMRSHPIKGEEICRSMKSLAGVLPVIRSHHERWDGGGYPDGLCGEEIPIEARILQIADIYDALTTARPYKPAFTPKQALGILDDEVSRGWRDPKLVAMFKQLQGNGLNGGQDSLFLNWPELELMGQSIAGTRPFNIGLVSLERCQTSREDAPFPQVPARGSRRLPPVPPSDRNTAGKWRPSSAGPIVTGSTGGGPSRPSAIPKPELLIVGLAPGGARLQPHGPYVHGRSFR